MNLNLHIVLLIETICASSASSLIEIDRNHESPAKENLYISPTVIHDRIFPGLFPEFPSKIIVGGVEAEVGRYPYMVSLLTGNYPVCGGTLIDPEWVISAAHCADYATHVLIGHHDFKDIPESAERILVSYEVIHPSFDGSTMDNDVLMIKLTTASSFPVTQLIGDEEEVSVGTNVTTIGWGTTTYRGTTSDVLREVQLQSVSNLNCDEAYSSDVTDSMMCAYAPGKDSCQGDSGGPLMIKSANASSDIQIGVVSWGYGCACEGYPGVYASLAEMEEFITITMEDSINPNPEDEEDGCPFPDDMFDYSGCIVRKPCFVGDSYCDFDYNTESCNYDGGDCGLLGILSGSLVWGITFACLPCFLCFLI